MALNLTVYSNANNVSRTITFDFFNDIAAIEAEPSLSNEIQFFFKASTSARDLNNAAYPVRIITGLDDLALNGVKQSAVDTDAEYSNVKAMVIDYTYDMIHGHTANQFGSGCKVKPPMKFS